MGGLLNTPPTCMYVCSCLRSPAAPHPNCLRRHLLPQFGGSGLAHAAPLWALRPAAGTKKRKPDGKTRVLILMSDTGGGHRASAEALKAGGCCPCSTGPSGQGRVCLLSLEWEQGKSWQWL